MTKHKHTIDWLRQTNITADEALAEKRWSSAVAVAEDLSAADAVELLRLFLFESKESAFATELTDRLVKLDPEFPVSKNIEELRQIAGLAMVVKFGASTHEADMFALGCEAADFPAGRISPMQQGIIKEAKSYALKEAAIYRPNNFKDNTDEIVKPLIAKVKALTEAETTGEAEKIKSAEANYRKTLSDIIASSYRTLSNRTAQLAEENGSLWWALASFSETLEKSIENLSMQEYPLIAAFELARRIFTLPAPPSVGPLLTRAVSACGSGKKRATLGEYLTATDQKWVTDFAASVSIGDCTDLVPISTALSKLAELGDIGAVVKALPRFCPGFKDRLFIPAEIAHQFFKETVFLRAVNSVRG